MGAFDIYHHFIQMVVRGTVLGQQWQISPCWVATALESGSSTVLDFPEDILLDWFSKFWNGTGGTDAGLAGAFRANLTEDCTVNEVRVYARSQAMAFPQQLVFAGSIVGNRGGGGQTQASFNAWSCYARADKFGQRGAAFRLPGVLDADQQNNFFTASALNVFRAPDQILDRLSNPLKYDANGLLVVDGFDTLTAVNTMRPAVVNRVQIVENGQTDLNSKKEFPYESNRPIFAYSCTPWQVHDYVSTQISRKVGRGR